MEEKVINIGLKIDRWNIIMNALAGRPYAEVVELVADIQRQASGQIETPAAGPNPEADMQKAA